MRVFAFSAENLEDSGFLICGDGKLDHENAPKDLIARINTAHANGANVRAVSVGLDGDWFLKTDKYIAYPFFGAGDNRIPNVLNAAQSFNISVNSIESFTFMPDPAGFIAKIRKDDGSFELYFSGLPPGLESYITTLSPSEKQQITSIAAGANNSWIVILASGGGYYCNLPAPLDEKFGDLKKRADSKASYSFVALSLTHPTRYYVEHSSGAASFSMPESWHQRVSTFEVTIASQKKVHHDRINLPHGSRVVSFSADGASHGVIVCGGGRWDRESLQHIPHDLMSAMMQALADGEIVQNISVGKDGDWFLNTNRFNSCYKDDPRRSNVQGALDFLQVPINSVEFFTFVPDPTGYVCKARLTDGTFNLIRQNVPESLEKHLATLTMSAVQDVASVSVGASGGWVVSHRSGKHTWVSIPDRLVEQIRDGSKRGEKVAALWLSLWDDTHYYIEYTSGLVHYWLPSSRHAALEAYKVIPSARQPAAATRGGAATAKPGSTGTNIIARAAALTGLAVAGADSSMDIYNDNDGDATNDPSATKFSLNALKVLSGVLSVVAAFAS